MTELNKENLDKALEQLPEYDPAPELWGRIADELDFQDQVKPLLAELPEQEPQEDAWQHIAHGLEERAAIRKFSFIKPLRYAAAVAAAMLLGCIGWKYIPASAPTQEHISYSIEHVQPVDSLNDSPKATERAEEDAKSFIAQSCLQEPDKCSKPDIKVLKEELDELNQQDEILRSAASRYGEDEKIVQDKIKLENMKAQVIKELVKKLSS